MSDGEGSPGCLKKADDLEVNESADGFIVFQTSRDRVHYLNRTALLVLELCTGENDATEITSVVQEAFELTDPPATEIEACMAQLQSEGLVA